MGPRHNDSNPHDINNLKEQVEHGIKVVERVKEKILCRIVIVTEMQFCIMSEKGRFAALFIQQRLQEEHQAKGKKYYVYVEYPAKTFSHTTK